MVRKKTQVQKIVKDYVRGFPSGFRIEGVFLFGSYATGKAREGSDIDLIIISPDFKKMGFLERLEFLSILRKKKSSLSNAMDIIGYTPEEFKTIDQESVVMRRAKKEAVAMRV